MERKSQPQHHARGRGRSNHSSSSYLSQLSSQVPPSHNSQSSSHATNNVNLARWKNNACSTAGESSPNSMDNEDLPTIEGTCPFMCPVEERVQREKLRDLAVFERLNGNLNKSSSSLAVKKFCRTISMKHVPASNLRPLPILEQTLNHLFSLLGSGEYSFRAVYDFIFDRTRSIRQDLSMQNIIGDRAIKMYERMVKFHILSQLKLRRCGDSSDLSSMLYLNMEQLVKTLKSLYNLYEANGTVSTYENEAEFRSIYVLLHLGSNWQPMVESLSLWFQQIQSLIIKSKEMCFARRVLRYFRLGNYKRFICTVEAEASDLQYCILEPYMSEVRALALSCINHGGYKLHPYPLADLSRLLMMEEPDVESFCHDCGFETSADESGTKFLPTKQNSLCNSSRGFQNYYLLDSERLKRLSAVSTELQ